MEEVAMQTGTVPPWVDLLAKSGLSGADTAPYLAPGPGVQDSAAAARVTESADGVPLDSLWQEFQDVTRLWNEHRLALADLVSFRTTAIAEAVPAGITSDSFELADETTIPKSQGADDLRLLAYTLDVYDLRTAFTWKFLRDSSAEQIRQFYVRALDADTKLQSGLIFGRLLDPTEGLNEVSKTVYGLYNGSDGIAPPPFMGKTFPTNHTHYLVSQASVVDSLDLEEQFDLITEHGYGTQAGSQLITFVSKAESLAIQGFRVGVESRPGGPKSRWDFLPSASAPPRVQMGTVVGQVAPSDFGGLPIAGSFGPTWLCETPYMPSGYVLTVATGGSNSILNPVGMREHPKAQYQGMRALPGNQVGYPLVDAFYTHELGVGVRHRGAAVVTQIKASGSYDVPVIAR